MWSYVPKAQRIPGDHPLRPLRAMVEAILRDLSPQFDQLSCQAGPTLDSARAPAPRSAPAGALQRAQRAAADGATRLQLAGQLFPASATYEPARRSAVGAPASTAAALRHRGPAFLPQRWGVHEAGATPHVVPVTERFSTLTAIDPLNVRAPLSAKTPFAVITKVRAPLICP
jgi:hypothetical protein